MKKRSLLLILVLAISLAIPVFLTQTQPVYTQPMTHTYTFTPPLSSDFNNTQVTFTVTTNLGVLIEGNVAGWSLTINANSNSTLENITINAKGPKANQTKIYRGLMFPLSNNFASDENMNLTGTFPDPLNNTIYIYSLVKYENVLLFTDTAGLPSITSFNLSVTLWNNTKNETIPLASDVPVLSLIFPNPSEAPPVINYYLIILYSMVFLLPISLILTNRWLNIRKLKKEGSEEV